MRTSVRRTGFNGFIVDRSGQLVSTTGALRTSLALTFWAFDTGVTGSKTASAEAMR